MSADISGLKERLRDLEKQNRELKQQLALLKSHQAQNDELLIFERLLSELSTQLIDPSRDDIRKPIEHGLKLMSDFIGSMFFPSPFLPYGSGWKTFHCWLESL